MLLSSFAAYLNPDGVELYCFNSRPFNVSYEKLDLLLTKPIRLLEELDSS